jgi:hypothetical protein
MSEVDQYGSLDSKEALDIAKVWETYMGSWRSEKQVAELFEALKGEHSSALSSGQFSAVNNSIYKFIHEVARFDLEANGFLEAAEYLTKQLLETGNFHAANVINTLTFALLIPANDYERAEEWLTKAVYLEAGEQSENALNNLAIAYSMQGKDEKALALFLRSWGFSSTAYKPEAMYHIAHMLGKCSENDFTRGILYEVTQATDTDYAVWAQNCLWGQCGSKYKPSLNSPINSPGTRELLQCNEDDYVPNLFQSLRVFLKPLPGLGPLDPVEIDIDKFESPKFALEHVESHGRPTAPLIEFAQVHAIGDLRVHKVAMSLVLYGDKSISFSSLSSALLAEWSRGNLPNSVTLAQNILTEENFLPGKQPILNYAMQECLLSGVRSKAGYVMDARKSIHWEASYQKALAGFPMLGFMEIQADEGDLAKLAANLSEYCRSDYPLRYQDITSTIPLVANEILTFLMASEDAYLNFDSSKALASVANTLGLEHSSDEFMFLISGVSQFIERRISLLLETSRDHEYSFLTVDDVYFLVSAVMSISSSNLRILVARCAALKSWGLVSKSLFPLIDKIAILAWSRGARVDWSDVNLKSLDGFLETVGQSGSLTDVALMWENRELQPTLEALDSPLAQLVKGKGLMSLDMQALEALDISSLLTLCKIRSMPEKFYKFAMAKVPIEGVATLATNPDSFDLVQQQLGEQVPQDGELAYVAANTFVKDKSPDWPRSLPKVLTRMNNLQGLALLASDHRLQDSDLQAIASKANKKIAELIREHPNASDETKALAQLVA